MLNNEEFRQMGKTYKSLELAERGFNVYGNNFCPKNESLRCFRNAPYIIYCNLFEERELATIDETS